VVADIPGLIEGAHTGTGLGIKFLRHVERTRLLIHMVDVSGSSGRDPVRDLEIINGELGAFSATLAAKPQIVAATKIDALDDRAPLLALQKHCADRGIACLPISAVTGAGVRELLEAAWQRLEASAGTGGTGVDTGAPADAGATRED